MVPSIKPAAFSRTFCSKTLATTERHPSAATQFFEDAVMRDGLANHRTEILGLDAGQVNEGQIVGGVPAAQLLSNPPGYPLPLLLSG